jgi:hypothetical protein
VIEFPPLAESEPIEYELAHDRAGRWIIVVRSA